LEINHEVLILTLLLVVVVPINLTFVKNKKKTGKSNKAITQDMQLTETNARTSREQVETDFVSNLTPQP